MKKSLWLKQAVVPAMLMLCLALSGCGVKIWPSPVKSEDIFKIASVNGTRSGSCLTVTVKLSGAYQNLANISMQYQADGDGPGEGCPTCPFFPANRENYIPGSSNISSDGAILSFTECGLDPQKSYRWRIVASNVYDTLGLAISDVFTAAP
ncbi:hypothetical protein [Maridesulfovibrio bastinii]|uniref:hypothetical protein n=1 Tax=Maridesulfovibrio bastinii TaxID=47157 RepID=UPI000416ADCD|nr:hypothetical protein [Maridesulfovibrio bastinii]